MMVNRLVQKRNGVWKQRSTANWTRLVKLREMQTGAYGTHQTRNDIGLLLGRNVGYKEATRKCD